MEYNNKLESTMMLAVTFEAGVGHLAQALRGGGDSLLRQSKRSADAVICDLDATFTAFREKVIVNGKSTKQGKLWLASEN